MGEALDAEVARMHLEQAARAVGDGIAVVGQVGAVRGADLAQAHTRRLDQVGQAEAGADLDEFAA